MRPCLASSIFGACLALILALAAGCRNSAEAPGLDTWKVTVRLVETTPFPEVSEIRPYEDALLAHRYRVLSAEPLGADTPVLGADQAIIMHWAIRGKKPAEAVRKLEDGTEKTFRVQRFSDRKDLKGRYIKNGLDASDLQLYVEAE